MKNVIVAVFALALITGCGSDDPGTPAVGGGNGGTGGSAGNGGPGGMGGGGGGAEDCDGQDNDGDGFVDEGLGARPCSTACGMGNEVCSQGSWGGCDAPPVVDEFCDAVDNDCDGNVDEGLARECSTACGMGTESCRDGDWVDCDAPAVVAEECDGQDNDCDGNTDENVLRACTTECGMGSQACIGNNEWGECDSVIVADEACGNSEDDDCDGQVDEGCGCSEGDVQPCSDNIGACVRGTQTCDADGNWGDCVDADGEPVKVPGQDAEDCNGIDDDCNGIVDDLMIDAECGQDGPGECRTGRLTCDGGVRACVGGVEPTEETCDTLDNDCDGNVDEDADAIDERCDQRDNDCDGRVDEDIAPDQWEANDTCQELANLGGLTQPERDEMAPSLARQGIVTGGNEDWFGLRTEEDSGACVPLTGFGTRDYNIVVSLSDYLDDVVYELCGKFHRSNDAPLFNTSNEEGFGEACGNDQTCVRSDSGMPMNVSFTVEDSCAGNNDGFAAVRVRVVDGAPACAPYTLRFSAVNAE